MSPARSPLDAVVVSSPCTVPWQTMKGDDRVRRCGSCRLNVYDFSALSRAEAEALLLRTEGRLCVRLHRRRDGTLITKDCEPVRSALARRVQRIRTLAAALLGVVGLAACKGGETYGGHATIGVFGPPDRPTPPAPDAPKSPPDSPQPPPIPK